MKIDKGELINKQKAQLLSSIDEMLEAFEGGVALSDENWDDMHGGLIALGLPEENLMLGLIDNCRNDKKAFQDLRTYFERFYDAQMSAAVKSSTISEDYRTGKYGSDREFMGYTDMIRKNSAASIVATAYENLKKVQEANQDYYTIITEGSR